MSYCNNCGNELGEEDLYCSRCGNPVEGARRALMTENIEVPYPDTDSARLEVVVRSAGRVNVSGGAREGFVEGSVEFDNPELTPEVTVSGNRVRIIQSERFIDRIRSNPVNRWNLYLGDAKPFSMRVKCGVSMGRWELGGLPLTELDLEAGVSRNSVSFDEPNPGSMGVVRLSAGAGDLDAEGLLNARFERMQVDGGVGEVGLTFTGEKLEHDAKVDIGGGVGSFRIIVDEKVPTRVTVEGLASVSLHGGFMRTQKRGFPLGGIYENEANKGYEGSRLDLDIRMGVGSVTLDTT